MGKTRTLLQLKPPTVFPPPPNNNLFIGSNTSNNNNVVKDNISPSVLLIIIILAIIFFLSGLLHLLIRYLWQPQARDPDDITDLTVLQGQLQQLFHLHDSGVDQSFIDTLPIFHYNSIIGLKTKPFDCAVCLSEFEPDDKLRLLPKCSHAFHMDCIDTWLLSHSTCPICRACLINDYNNNVPHGSPIVLLLESGSDDNNNSREIQANPDIHESGSGSTRFDPTHEDPSGVVPVKLGKIRNVDDDNGNEYGEGSSCSVNGEARRCFSMGSFAYVMDESTLLHVPIREQVRRKERSALLLNTKGNRLAMSECDFESRRDFRFCDLDGKRVEGEGEGEGKSKDSRFGVVSRKESMSVSKIWLREKKEKRKIGFEDYSTRRAVSFRFPLDTKLDDGDDLKERNNGKLGSRSTISEMDLTKWGESGGGSEFGYDEENQSCYSVDSWQANSSTSRAPSFARRTLLWLSGKQNKVVHSSSFSADL